MIKNEELILNLTASIVTAALGREEVSVSSIAALISSTSTALIAIGEEAAPAVEAAPEPAVSIRASIKPDYLVCLEDGKKLKMLKRHLASHYNLTPEQYRARWGLAADYPMCAPNYAAKRRELAKKIGLGRKPGAKVASRAAKTK